MKQRKKRPTSPLAQQVRAFERMAIEQAILEHGSRGKAAEALGITRQTLRVKLLSA